MYICNCVQTSSNRREIRDCKENERHPTHTPPMWIQETWEEACSFLAKEACSFVASSTLKKLACWALRAKSKTPFPLRITIQYSQYSTPTNLLPVAIFRSGMAMCPCREQSKLLRRSLLNLFTAIYTNQSVDQSFHQYHNLSIIFTPRVLATCQKHPYAISPA